MEKQLTAAELHELCEPLFAAWPECRPTCLCFVMPNPRLLDRPDRVRCRVCYEDPQSPGESGGDIDTLPEVAAALIRVAVEDALFPLGYVLRRDGPGWYAAVLGGTNADDMSLTNATLVHGSPLRVLVSAALAVASARKEP